MNKMGPILAVAVCLELIAFGALELPGISHAHAATTTGATALAQKTAADLSQSDVCTFLAEGYGACAAWSSKAE